VVLELHHPLLVHLWLEQAAAALGDMPLLVLVVLAVEEQEHLEYLLLVVLERLIQVVAVAVEVVKAHLTSGLLVVVLVVRVWWYFVTLIILCLHQQPLVHQPCPTLLATEFIHLLVVGVLLSNVTISFFFFCVWYLGFEGTPTSRNG
jgi:hypothetical protein